MDKILFLPFNIMAETDGEETILEVVFREGIPIRSSCGGRGRCGQCRVLLETGEGLHPPPSLREMEILGEELIKKGYRLACETKAFDGAIIHIPEESRITDRVILTSETDFLYPARLRPFVERYYVEVPEPSLEFLRADRERLFCALEERYGLKRLSMDPVVLKKLPDCLRKGGRGKDAIVWGKREVIDLQSGGKGKALGMAFDIGTTTVVGYLFDIQTGQRLSVKSDLNPQISYGADVITRISFCQERKDGLDTLRGSIVACINRIIYEACSEAKRDNHQVMEITVVGNTAMNHFFLGLNPVYLAMAPYPPAVSGAQCFKARDLGIDICESGYVYLMPLKAGFVGSDTISCILATGLHRKIAPAILIDLGTNGEIVTRSKNGIACSSTAAGPAFEGGHITWGMRASSGAVERIRIDPRTFEVKWKTINDQPPVGLCGSGVISAVAEMIRRGIVLGKGNFDEGLKSDRLREGKDGLEFVLVWAKESGVGKDIFITQKDVAELLLAKAALHAGAMVLMEEMGIERVEKIFLAGAFGNYVDPQDACTIGLFPEENKARIVPVGNAAGYGSCLVLLDRSKRREAEGIARRLKYVELAATRRFQELFISSMFFPSAKDYKDEF